MTSHAAERGRSSLQSRVIKSVMEFGQLRDEWDSLCARCPETTVFTTWEWTNSVWKHMSDDCRLFVVTVESEEGVVAIAPLAVDYSSWPLRVLRFLGAGSLGWSISDYCGIIVAEGCEQAALRSLLDELLRRSREWDVLDLQEVPEHSCLMTIWLDEVKRRGMRFAVTKQSTSHPMPLPDSWSDFLERLSAKSRSTYVRKERRLAREHQVQIERIERPDRLNDAMCSLFTLHNERWVKLGQPGVFGSPRARAFHLELATSLLERGRLSLLIMSADGVPVGATYSFRYGGAEYYYASGFQSADEWAVYSLGKLLLLHAVRDAITDGLATFDLTRGDEAYKETLRSRTVPNYRLLIARSGIAFRCYSLASRLRGGAARLVAKWRGRRTNEVDR
jgi:CelD/BcsL family acetyltransferase involved in cellulose biosynthesis